MTKLPQSSRPGIPGLEHPGDAGDGRFPFLFSRVFLSMTHVKYLHISPTLFLKFDRPQRQNIFQAKNLHLRITVPQPSLHRLVILLGKKLSTPSEKISEESGHNFQEMMIMKKSRFTNEQIASALRQVETGVAVEEVCRKISVS